MFFSGFERLPAVRFQDTGMVRAKNRLREALMTAVDSPRSIYRRRRWRADGESTIYEGDSSEADFSIAILAGLVCNSLMDRVFYRATLNPQQVSVPGHLESIFIFPSREIIGLYPPWLSPNKWTVH